MSENKPMTGYPSIDKPWLKYYSEEAINAPLPECTMYQYIWENNKDHLSDIALRYYGTKITYGKLFENIKKAASAFWAMGVRPGDVVTIMSMHTPETIYAIYGLNYIGAVANMVYMTLSEKEIIATLKNTKSRLFFVLDVALNKIEAIQSEIKIPSVLLCVSDSMLPHIKLLYRLKGKAKKSSFLTWKDFLAKGIVKAPLATDSTTSAVIVYTSGTTGEPKGVMLTNNNINAVSLQYKYSFPTICRGDTILVFMPPFLSIGLCFLHTPICLGVQLIICANPEPNNVVNEFIKHRPNHFVTAPSNMLMVVDRNIKDYSFLKTFGAGGESLSIQEEQKVNALLKKGGAAIQCSPGYGMTEFSATVTTNSNIAHKEGTIGIPLVKTNVRITDQTTCAELSYNQVGELLFNTPSQMNGYVYCRKDNEPIVEDFGEGVKWVHTGDLGFIDKDGFVHYTGRLKRIYMTRIGTSENGSLIKIFPQRIEECIESLDVVYSCGVIVRQDAKRLHVPIAFVSLSEKAIDTKTVESIIQIHVNKELPEHDRPESIHILETMPLTPSGKIDYRALEEISKRNSI